MNATGQHRVITTNTTATTMAPLTRDEYVDLRNRQDQQLRSEFTSIRGELTSIRGCIDDLIVDVEELKHEHAESKANIAAIQAELHEFKTEMYDFKSDMYDFKIDMYEFKAQTYQFQAQMRNSLLKNPTLPIQPVVQWKNGQQAIPTQFPRNAKEFYSLREPATKHLQQMLIYLTQFYDIRVVVDDRSGDSDEEEDIVQEAERIVEQLETILGLDEYNFVKFKQRARELAAQTQAPGPKKRIRLIRDDPISRPHQSRKLDICIRNSSDEGSLKEDSERTVETRLYWGTRSTPSSQRPKIRPPAAAGKPRSPSAPSSTQPNSSPRSSRIRAGHTPEAAPPADKSA